MQASIAVRIRDARVPGTVPLLLEDKNTMSSKPANARKAPLFSDI